MTADELVAAMGCTRERAEIFAQPLTVAAERFAIDTPKRMAAWLGQIAVECGRLSVLIENLNYSAKRMAEVWPGRFRDEKGQPSALARRLAGNPEAIANHVYANRNGNGSVQSGDGWLYRGRGCGQITGRANYRLVAAGLELPLEAMPEYLEIPEYAASSSAFWFARRIPLALADGGEVRQISLLWNGGTHGLTDRLAATRRALEVLSD